MLLGSVRERSKIASGLAVKANASVAIFLNTIKTKFLKTNLRTTAQLANAWHSDSFLRDQKKLAKAICRDVRGLTSILGDLVVCANIHTNSTVLSSRTNARVAVVMIFNLISAAYLAIRSSKSMRQFGKPNKKDVRTGNQSMKATYHLRKTQTFSKQLC